MRVHATLPSYPTKPKESPKKILNQKKHGSNRSKEEIRSSRGLLVRRRENQWSHRRQCRSARYAL